MGLLDQVTGAIGGMTGGSQGGVQAVLLQQLISMLSKPGALSNLMAAFQQNGLGNIVQSWIGTGQNLPISGAQVQQVLGTGTLGEMAKHAGIAMPDAATALAGLLPQVVDKISPNGQAPAGNDLGGLLSSVGKLFG
ncbi:MAG: YidB family protein [Gammaproteobacteria bacterium]